MAATNRNLARRKIRTRSLALGPSAATLYSMTTQKILAKFSAVCPICNGKIKAGSHSISYVTSEPVAHWDCHEAMSMSPEARLAEVDKYGMSDDGRAFALAAYEVEAARWEEALARHAAKLTRAPSTHSRGGEVGSFGGSQLAEDMGDFSGR